MLKANKQKLTRHIVVLLIAITMCFVSYLAANFTSYVLLEGIFTIAFILAFSTVVNKFIVILGTLIWNAKIWDEIANKYNK